MATIVQGPIDSLTSGLLAGGRLAALAASLKQRKIENQFTGQRLQLATRELALKEAHAGAEFESERAESFLTRLKGEQLQQFLQAGGVGAGIFKTRAEGGEAFGRGEQALAQGKKIDIDRLNLLAEALATGQEMTAKSAIDLASIMGSGTPEVLGAMLMGRNQQLMQENQNAIRESEANQVFRQLLATQGLIKAQRTSGPVEKALLAEREENLGLIKQLELVTGMSRLLGEEVDPESLKRTEATIRNLKKRQAEILTQLEGRQGNGVATRRDTSGLVHIHSDADFAKVRPGTDFVDPEGNVRHKPK